MSNIETALSGLAAEINELHKQGQSVREVMGHKLIAVRAILREQNGWLRGNLDATGNPAPRGWYKWVSENLNISCRHASVCMQFAVNPEQVKAAITARADRLRYTPAGALQRVRKAWKDWSTGQREEYSRGVLALLDMP